MNYWHLPNIDPTIQLLGPLHMRWHSLLYVAGFLVARSILSRLSRQPRFHLTENDANRLILILVFAAVFGSRLFYCVFYDTARFLENPSTVLNLSDGGLSFHGAIVGVILACGYYTKRHFFSYWNLADALALSIAPALALARLANFVAGDFYGSVSYVPWAIIFPNGGPEPRHPTQLYGFLFEGVFLFLLLWNLQSRLKKDGQLAGVFLVSYSVVRFCVEFFRDPDPRMGYLFGSVTMGQWLSMSMLLLSALVTWLFWFRRPPVEANER